MTIARTKKGGGKGKSKKWGETARDRSTGKIMEETQ